ncbi:MAG: hypothetical protein KatS3mg131_2449 [Candidatus Tectimicrobiota bacterium]|nr:MAG: hypothetical protein KatS3mg131_2449 [Candidatus Tectomicrobia bacterium]
MGSGTRRQKGLSLIETLVALVVLVVGLAAVQRLFPQGLATGRQALARTQATLLAKGQLEQLRLQGFAHLAGLSGAPTPPAPFRDSAQQVIFPRFRWQVEVQRVAEDLLAVSLRVRWPWPRHTGQVELVTYVSRP